MTDLTTTSYTFGQVHSDPSDSCDADFSTGSYVVLRSGPEDDSPEVEKICLTDIEDDYTAVIPSTMSRLDLHVTDEDTYGIVADYKVCKLYDGVRVAHLCHCSHCVLIHF